MLTLDAGTMKTPGFLRCRVWTKYDGRTVEGRATAAFEPEKIKPTAVLPNDFNTFSLANAILEKNIGDINAEANNYIDAEKALKVLKMQ